MTRFQLGQLCLILRRRGITKMTNLSQSRVSDYVINTRSSRLLCDYIWWVLLLYYCCNTLGTSRNIKLSLNMLTFRRRCLRADQNELNALREQVVSGQRLLGPSIRFALCPMLRNVSARHVYSAVSSHFSAWFQSYAIYTVTKIYKIIVPGDDINPW